MLSIHQIKRIVLFTEMDVDGSYKIKMLVLLEKSFLVLFYFDNGFRDYNSLFAWYRNRCGYQVFDANQKGFDIVVSN
jgi:hypothetical protein